MNRIIAGIAAVFCAVTVMAVPPACPSVQWNLGQPSGGLNFENWVAEVAVVDYDEDGKLDVVGVLGGNSSRTLVWWKGAGDNTFGAYTAIVSNFSITNIAIADATGDGRLDVIVGLYSSPALYILPGTGSGRGPAITKSLTISPTVIYAMNRDADPAAELVVSDAGGNRFAVYDNIAGTITELAKVTTTQLPRGVVSADFDLDGRMDVAVGLLNQHTVAVYYGNANGTYSAPVAIGGIDPWNIVIGDLNGDGKQDIVAGNWESDFTGGEGNVSIYMNQGGRVFTHTTFSVDKPGKEGDTIAVLLADVSGDGLLDLVAGVVNGTWTTTAVGRGDGTFRTPTYLYTLLGPSDPLGANGVAVADFNTDGVLDLLIGAGFDGIYPATRSCTTQVDLYTVSPVISIGQQATLHAHVSGFGPDTPMPHGTITLRDGATTVDSSLVDPDGKASFAVSGLTLGDHPLSAEFSGNTTVTPATSVVVTQKVTSETTQTIITLPGFPAIYGQPFPIQITIDPPGFEWVTVDVDGVKSQHYTGGSFNPSLEPGSHTVSAQFLGSQYRPPSDSLPVTFDVAKGTPAMAKTGALAVRSGTAHSFTFNVTGSGATGPGGSVQLIEGTTVLGSGALVNGSVTLNATLLRGAHDVRAVYSGDARYLDVTQNFTLEVLPNQPFVIEARGLTTGVHIAYLLPANTNLSTLQLFRRPAGSPSWQLVPGWSSATGMDTSVPSVGDVYEYQLNASLNNGTPMTSLPDSALLFHDDLLSNGILVKRAHFSELRSAVNLLRAQAGLPAFEFDASYNESTVRAPHLGGLRTALTQARQTLGMSVPAFSGGGIGTLIQTSHIQELRELAR